MGAGAAGVWTDEEEEKDAFPVGVGEWLWGSWRLFFFLTFVGF